MSEPSNILWIVADCLRYDALSATGYHRPTTEPIDDRLDNDFVSFNDAATQSGFTLTVLSSLITGDYPSTHGVLRWNDLFPENASTYRDAASSAGFPPTEAIPGMNFISEEWNLTGAFDKVHSLSEEKSQRDCNQATADEICDTALDRIDEENTFNHLLWFFDLHDPWLSETEFAGDNPKR
ncbi:MAG: sulfatase-like hydrolase/transferase, partial [Halobacteriaceae archaeon]